MKKQKITNDQLDKQVFENLSSETVEYISNLIKTLETSEVEKLNQDGTNLTDYQKGQTNVLTRMQVLLTQHWAANYH